MKAKGWIFLLIVIAFISTSCSSSGEQLTNSDMGFFEKIWQQNKAIVIIAVVLIVLILVVLKVVFTQSAAEKELGAPVEVEPGKTEPDEVDGTILDSDVAGSVTVLVRGEDIGSFNITADGIIVGRDPNAVNIHIADNIVSKTHLNILPRGDRFFIADLGSTNGTYVNGEKITETLVSPEDMVQLGKKGDIKLVFKK